MIDIATEAAIELLAEFRATEQPDEFNALDASLLENGTYIPGTLIRERARQIARQRHLPWREWQGQFRKTLKHCLPAISHLN